MAKVKDFMASIGLSEVVTYSFTSPSLMDRAAVPQDSRCAI
jgi:phenylalanyl-tRNA synthetase beta subunit